MAKLTKVGHGTRKLASGVDWPYDVWISHDDPELPIAVAEGFGFAGVGGSIAAHELLQTKFADYVTICNCQWLVAEIKRLHKSGEPITAQKLEDHWRSLSNGPN